MSIEGCEGTSLGQSFLLFRLRGVLNFYRFLSKDDHQSAKALLESVRAAQLQDFQLCHGLMLSNSQLVLV